MYTVGHRGLAQDAGVVARQDLFFDTHSQTLDELFDILGMEIRSSDGLAPVVAATQPWVGGDHSRPDYQLRVSDDQKYALKELYEHFDFVGQQAFPEGHLDQIVVLGAIHFGNNRRARFVGDSLQRHDLTTDRVVLLGGERYMYPEVERGDFDANIRQVRALGRSDAWLEHLQALPDEAIDETDMIRLAVTAQIGRLTTREIHVRSNESTLVDRPAKRYECALGRMAVTLLHTPAVQRPNGKPRHTTEACIADWLQTYPDLSDDARVGFVGAQPHLGRMVRSAQRIIHAHGRNIQLIAGGPGASEQTPHHIFLGEVARSLYEDAVSLARVE